MHVVGLKRACVVASLLASDCRALFFCSIILLPLSPFTHPEPTNQRINIAHTASSPRSRYHYHIWCVCTTYICMVFAATSPICVQKAGGYQKKGGRPRLEPPPEANQRQKPWHLHLSYCFIMPFIIFSHAPGNFSL